MTMSPSAFYIATVWRVNEEVEPGETIGLDGRSWYREVYRTRAHDREDFVRYVTRESADDELYIGPVGFSRQQEAIRWTANAIDAAPRARTSQVGSSQAKRRSLPRHSI